MALEVRTVRKVLYNLFMIPKHNFVIHYYPKPLDMLLQTLSDIYQPPLFLLKQFSFLCLHSCPIHHFFSALVVTART